MSSQFVKHELQSGLRCETQFVFPRLKKTTSRLVSRSQRWSQLFLLPNSPSKFAIVCGMNPVDSYSSVIDHDFVNDPGPVCGPHVEWHRWPVSLPLCPSKSTIVCGMNPVDSYSSVIDYDFINDPVCGPHVEWHRWPPCIFTSLQFCHLGREFWAWPPGVYSHPYCNMQISVPFEADLFITQVPVTWLEDSRCWITHVSHWN